MSDLREDPFAAHRPLWDELDTVQQAVRAAIAADDMQAWAEHAGRGAEIYEELARLAGWRDETPKRHTEQDGGIPNDALTPDDIQRGI